MSIFGWGRFRRNLWRLKAVESQLISPLLLVLIEWNKRHLKKNIQNKKSVVALLVIGSIQKQQMSFSVENHLDVCIPRCQSFKFFRRFLVSKDFLTSSQTKNSINTRICYSYLIYFVCFEPLQLPSLNFHTLHTKYLNKYPK